MLASPVKGSPQSLVLADEAGMLSLTATGRRPMQVRISADHATEAAAAIRAAGRGETDQAATGDGGLLTASAVGNNGFVEIESHHAWAPAQGQLAVLCLRDEALAIADRLDAWRARRSAVAAASARVEDFADALGSRRR